MSIKGYITGGNRLLWEREKWKRVQKVYVYPLQGSKREICLDKILNIILYTLSAAQTKCCSERTSTANVICWDVSNSCFPRTQARCLRSPGAIFVSSGEHKDDKVAAQEPHICISIKVLYVWIFNFSFLIVRPSAYIQHTFLSVYCLLWNSHVKQKV